MSSLVLVGSLLLPQTELRPPRPASAPSQTPGPHVRAEPLRPWAPRLLGVGTAAVGTLGFGATIGLQSLDVRGADLCARTPDGASCLENSKGLRATGLLMFYSAGFTAGFMFGRGRAMADVNRGGGRPGRREGLVLLGATLAVASAKALEVTAIVVNGEKTCRADPSCRQRLLRSGYSATNVSSVGLSVGLALMGYVVGERRFWDRVDRLSLTPSYTSGGGGLSVSGQF